MGTDEEYYYNERTFKRPNLQTRLQSGMNLQICFMNDAVGDQDVRETNSDNKKEEVPPVKNLSEVSCSMVFHFCMKNQC